MTPPHDQETIEKYAKDLAEYAGHSWDELSEEMKEAARVVVLVFYDAVKASVNRAIAEFIANPPKHKYWAPGEPDCPKDIKCSNGEIHTLRCKICGQDDPRNQICTGAPQ